MVRIYILAGLCLVAIGACIGWSVKPERSQPTAVQAEVKQSQVKVVTRTVIKTVKPDGTVITKEVEKESLTKKESSKPSLPKPDYRVGVQTGLDLRYTVTAGRRLLGDLWLDSAFKPSTKDITAGFSYEF